MFYPRLLLPKLEQELYTKENTIITGMRQVGKTSLLEHLFSLIKSDNKIIFDFENPLNRKIFEEEDYNAIWNNLKPLGVTNEKKAYIFLDEVQHLKSIGSIAKYLSDHWDVKFFLTGSSSYYLKNLFSESMSGRKIIFEVYPLTFSEFLVFKGVKREQMSSFLERAQSKNHISYKKLLPYYLEYLEYGGFPKVVLTDSPDRKRGLLSDIFTSYFEIDVQSLADFKESSKLRDLILLLIPRVGSKIEITKLAQSLGISRETVYAYLSFLKNTYFISLLSKFSASIDRQAAGMQKLYLCDSGMANFLGKTSEGALLEQSVFQNLYPTHSLNFYNKGVSEIDFIVDEKIALEVKTSVGRRDISNLKKRTESIKITDRYVVTKEYSQEKETVLVTDL